MTLISLIELEKLSSEKRENYLERLRIECKERRVAEQTMPFIVKALGKIASIIRPYDLMLEGVENIPSDTEVVFLCNHSNSHDMFTVVELFCRLKMKVSSIVAWDGLSWFSRLFFRLINGILIKRDSTESINKGVSSCV